MWGGTDLAFHLINSTLVAKLDEDKAGLLSGGAMYDDDASAPGACKCDFTNCFNSTSRSKMLAQAEDKKPTWLRFVCFCCAWPVKLVTTLCYSSTSVINPLLQ